MTVVAADPAVVPVSFAGTPLASYAVPAEADTPALLVDPHLVRANAGDMADRLAARGVAFRPHAKTHKSVQVARLLLEAGAVGLTCATLGEAGVFAAAGVADVFVAYPVWASGAKADRLRRLAAACRLTVGVDSVEGAAQLVDALRGAPVRVLLEVDSGERRTGALTEAEAGRTAAAVVAAGLELVGCFTHGGHSYGSPAAPAAAADDEVAALTWGARAVVSGGGRDQVRSAGSTPTALLSARDGVTEERPGTFVFGDRQQVMLGAHDPSRVALLVAATVVSSDRTGQFVLDAGAKTLAKDRNPLLDGFGSVLGYDAARITRLYDHHAIVEANGPLPAVGERVAVVPNHACPVVNLAEELLVVDGGAVVDRWSVDARVRNR